MGGADPEALQARVAAASKLLIKLSREHKRILIVTHIDADGLSSGSIAFQSLARKGATVSVRAIPDLDPKAIEALKSDRFDFYLFTDLGSGLVKELTAAFDESFIVVDHHQLPTEYAGLGNILNAWNFGYDGGTEVCSSTMAYLLAMGLDERNKDLSAQAVVGAVGDRQDSGPSRSLTSLNKVALDDSIETGLVSVSKDFLFHGRETRPIHEAVAMTYSPYLAGLSGAKDATLAALSNSGFALKEHGRWRNIAELSTEEKQRLMEVLTSFVGSSGEGSAVISSLIGEVYTMQLEDSLTPLRDAREFATLLNACGRLDEADVGIAVCLGDRYAALSEALRLVGEYRSKLNKAIQVVQMGGESVATHGDVTVVMGEDFIEERMTGSISSLLASSEKFKDKMVLVRARSGETELKFSSRLGGAFSREVNLGLIMKDAAERVGGIGGGHSMAAGAKIPIAKRDEFTRVVLEKISQ
jgi:RecJ-like exonuclease